MALQEIEIRNVELHASLKAGNIYHGRQIKRFRVPLKAKNHELLLPHGSSLIEVKEMNDHWKLSFLVYVPETRMITRTFVYKLGKLMEDV
jgi:hypothetical protein